MAQIIGIKIKTQAGKNPRIKGDTLDLSFPDDPQDSTMVVCVTTWEHGEGNNYVKQYEEKVFPSSMLQLLKLDGGKTTINPITFNPILKENSDFELL